MRTPWYFTLLAVLCLALLGCSNSHESDDENALAATANFDAYSWTRVDGGQSWEPRAGLQAVEIGGRFYVMGGRTPRPPSNPPIFGDSDIWADVWISDDQGLSWQRIVANDAPEHWPARAYFQAVVKDGAIFVLGGQNFRVVEVDCGGAPPQFCPPFVSESDFFNDVWRSEDGIDWQQLTADAGWSKRAGLSSAVLNGEIYVLGGSQNDDSAIVAGPAPRIYFNDVWKSADGVSWTQVTDDAPWEPRAGAVVVVKDEYLYLLGGEEGFVCEPVETCTPPYFNDVWRSKNGSDWELVTEAAGWSARPGHQCGVIQSSIVCFGGFGLVENPVDVWVSEDGAQWRLLDDPPWNAVSPDDIKYDFDALVVDGDSIDMRPALYTFGGDRETFDFDDPLNYLRVDDDVWRFSLP